MKTFEDYQKEIEDGTIKIDLGGHFASKPVDLKYISDIFCFKLARLARGKPIPEMDGELPDEIPGSILFQCNECGEPIAFKIKRDEAGNVNEVICTNPCKYPNGFPPIEFDLNVPSGKMVVGNDFRDEFKVMGNYDINLVTGMDQTSQRYAEVGLAHAFVGNTCPGVYRINSKRFVVGTQGSDEKNPVKRSKDVAGICTDLWWYSICDYDEFKRRSGKEPDDRYEQVVKCAPGVYHFKHVYHLVDRNDYENSQIYTYIDWVRKPDPVRNFLSEFKELNLTAGQVLRGITEKWDDIYHGDICIAATRHVAHGDTRDYHPNGFLCDDPDLTNDAPDMEIPLFEGPFCGELTEWSFICLAAGLGKDILQVIKDPKTIYLNESFTALCFNLLHQILRYGVQDSSNGNGYVKKQIDGTPKWAMRSLKGLAKKYPDRVPEYCKDFLTGKRAANL